MEIIKEIKIRKFRSIKSLTKDFSPTHLNILVGNNDQGKSNILRALNLFFNGHADLQQPFRFEDDYCYHAGTGTGIKREIRIDLTIEPPKNRFKYAKPLIWSKQWKKDGSIIESRRYIGTETDINQLDNVYKWLDKIRFRYIPAIKGKDYFSTLMGELYDVLNETYSEILSKQGQNFISGIQKITKSITSELNAQINLPNTIQVPSDFKDLFSNLDFGSTINNKTYHLKQRGDGIKARHIPIILKYMADQEKNISIPGYVKPDTIWGFEEPENNLELKYAFELAKCFKDYSKAIQIFVTTHSPAFYALDKNDDDGTHTFFVNQDKEKCTVISKLSNKTTDELHEPMGLLPLITPYLEKIYEKQSKIEELQSEIEKISKKSKCVILTEDGDDENLKTFLQLNNFKITETEIISYNGADQINASLLLAQYISKELPNAQIVIHRDQDYLSAEEINNIRQKIEKKGFHFFTTKGVDVENEFICPHHISELYPNISIDTAKEIINEATSESSSSSIKRLINHTLAKQKPEKNDYYGKIQEIEKLYADNPERYRYGKATLGIVISKIQKIIKKNPSLYKKTTHIQNKQLSAIAKGIWE